MKTFANFICAQSKKDSKLSLSNIPIYILYTSSWIPFTTWDDNRHKFIFHSTCILLFHITGISMLILYLYGIHTSKLMSVAPVVLLYTLSVTDSLMMIQGFLFLYKSWCKRKTQKIIKLLDENVAPRMWSAKYKLLMVVITYLACVSVCGRNIVWFYATVKDNRLPMIVYHFGGGHHLKNVLYMAHLVYMIYCIILFHMLPTFVVHISISLLTIIKDLKMKLNEIIENIDAVNANEKFDAVIKKFNRLINLIRIIDETYNIDIGWHMLSSVNNVICFIYLGIVLWSCYPPSVNIGPIVFDSFGLLLLMVTTATVHSKVGG